MQQSTVIHSIDDLVRHGFKFQKLAKKKDCPDMTRQETGNYCNNVKYSGSICHYGCSYKNCPYYRRR